MFFELYGTPSSQSLTARRLQMLELRLYENPADARGGKGAVSINAALDICSFERVEIQYMDQAGKSESPGCAQTNC